MRWRRKKEWIIEHMINHAEIHLGSINQGIREGEKADTNLHPTGAASKIVPVTNATHDNGMNSEQSELDIGYEKITSTEGGSAHPNGHDVAKSVSDGNVAAGATHDRRRTGANDGRI